MDIQFWWIDQKRGNSSKSEIRKFEEIVEMHQKMSTFDPFPYWGVSMSPTCTYTVN